MRIILYIKQLSTIVNVQIIKIKQPSLATLSYLLLITIEDKLLKVIKSTQSKNAQIFAQTYINWRKTIKKEHKQIPCEKF